MSSEQRSSQWSSSFGFIIACVGSAVGLGNLWKFPYITYENGGGAFVLVYLLSIVVVGTPIMLAEMLIGRHGHKNIYGTFKELSQNHWFWKGLGLLCIVTAFLILSFYSVVAGWTLNYFWSSLTGALSGLTPESVGPHFGAFVGDGAIQVTLHTLFMILTASIILRGTASIEKSVKILLPTLFFLVLIVMSLSLYKYGSSDTVNFLFNVDFSKLTSHGVLEALGHAFFTLSLGMGVMIIYGSYLPKSESLVKAGLWITLFDAVIAFMACFMMYPIIFGNEMNLSESASMLFTSLTIQFHSLPGGQYIAAVFYLLIAFAALTSTISLLEPVVSYIAEEFNIKRKRATLIGAFLIWLLGVFSALSNGASSFFTSLGVMDKFDYLSSNWTLPIGGMLISIFAGWVLKESDRQEELGITRPVMWYKLWLISVRYLSPALVFVVILFKLGLF